MAAMFSEGLLINIYCTFLLCVAENFYFLFCRILFLFFFGSEHDSLLIWQKECKVAGINWNQDESHPLNILEKKKH
jgi:hypothetical protein